jgi:serine/threonine-protein kinase RsbW
LERSFPSDCDECRSILTQILGQLEALAWDQRESFCIHLALEEALVNAVKHGNCSDLSKTVHVSCRISPQRFWAQITDQGCGFDPHKVPDCTEEENLERPCGRGIMLMKNFMSRVEYSSSGNRVILEKERGSGTCNEPESQHPCHGDCD